MHVFVKYVKDIRSSMQLCVADSFRFRFRFRFYLLLVSSSVLGIDNRYLITSN